MKVRHYLYFISSKSISHLLMLLAVFLNVSFPWVFKIFAPIFLYSQYKTS